MKNQTSNSNIGRFNGTCFKCGKRGHKKSECQKLKKRLEEMQNELANIHQEIENSNLVLMSHEEEVQTCKVISEDSDNKNEIENKEDQVFFMKQTQVQAKIINNI